MGLLGDLSGALLAFAYDNPLLVAAISALGLVLVLVLARRYGWATRALRHPRALAVAVVAAVLVGAPVAWYLVSPVFIRTELVEPPVAVAAPTLAPVPPVTQPSPSTQPGPPATPDAVDAVATSSPPATPVPWTPAAPRTGTFHGTDEFHFAKGTATVTETAPGEWSIRLAGFSVRNGPDLYVYLSPGARTFEDGAVEVAKLKATDGSFNVRVPAGTDPGDFASVLIWCRQFSHLFGWATLES